MANSNFVKGTVKILEAGAAIVGAIIAGKAGKTLASNAKNDFSNYRKEKANK